MTKVSAGNKDDQDVKEYEEYEPKCRPDSCWSWLVCVASTTCNVIIAGVIVSFGLLLPPFMETFDATRQATGCFKLFTLNANECPDTWYQSATEFYFGAWVCSLYVASGCLFSPVVSYISERFSYRFIAILGSFSGIIGFFLASLSSKLWMMYLTYGVLSGFGYIMIYNSSFLIVLQYFDKWRSVAIGIVASAPAISLFVMTQITQSLLTKFGWKGAIQGFSLLHIVCAFCSATFVPLDNMKEKSNNDVTVGKIKQLETTTQNTSLWRNHSFLIMLSSFTVVTFAYFVPTIHIVKHCEQELHIPGNKASMIFTYMAITSFIGRILFCKLGDLRYFKRFHLYQGGMTICGLCILCLPSARSFTSVVAIFTVYGLMEGAFNGQYSLLVLECCGKHKVNQAWGYLMLFIGVSNGLGSPMAGLMADKLGSYTVTFYTAGAILIAGASITSLMAFVKQQPEEAGETPSYDEELLVTEKITVV